jgi:GNAT superfamily N-acetyltransferase
VIRPVPAEDLERTEAAIEIALLESLRQRNTQAVNTHFAFEAVDPKGTRIGGVTGSTSYGWALIKLLWVDPNHRRVGLGRQLMQAAEAHARDLSCHSLWLDTSDPDASVFYARLGFETFGFLENGPEQTPEGHKRWFMRKALPHHDHHPDSKVRPR